jgi:glutathione synthase/RimK-type ligase-like ATP-grasp enzyme
VILVLTRPSGDPHFVAVTRELKRRAARHFVFDPAELGARASLSIDAERRLLRSGAETLDLATVRAVWVRRPGPVPAGRNLVPTEDEWVRREWEHATRGLWDLVDAVWLSPPEAIRRASRKVVQLDRASRLGLRVPPWMVTNEPARARAFIAEQAGAVVVKALAQPALLYPDRAVMLYTHPLGSEDIAQLESVRWGPVFLQRFVRKQADIRVTVVGERVFTVAIEPDGSEAARVDFRSVEIFDLPHRVMSLPAAVEGACVALVRGLGLRYGAIDLLLDAEGGYHFLEINPNGQWLWLEMITRLPIASAIADLLVGEP